MVLIDSYVLINNINILVSNSSKNSVILCLIQLLNIPNLKFKIFILTNLVDKIYLIFMFD